MTTKFTPAQIRFFLNASFSGRDSDGQTTLLNQFLSFSLPTGLRYRIEAMRRRLISDMAPVEARLKDVYEAYHAAIANDAEGEKGEETKAKAKVGDEAAKVKAEDAAEVKRKFEADIKEIDDQPIEFGGKLILATQLIDANMPMDACEFLAIPGVMGEWLYPFTVDDLPVA